MGASADVSHDLVGQVVGVDRDVCRDGRQAFKTVVQERNAADTEQGLGPSLGERTEPRATAGRQSDSRELLRQLICSSRL